MGEGKEGFSEEEALGLGLVGRQRWQNEVPGPALGGFPTLHRTLPPES